MTLVKNSELINTTTVVTIVNTNIGLGEVIEGKKNKLIHVSGMLGEEEYIFIREDGSSTAIAATTKSGYSAPRFRAPYKNELSSESNPRKLNVAFLQQISLKYLQDASDDTRFR